MDGYRRRPASGGAAGPVLLACDKCEQRLAKEGRFRQIAQLQQAMAEVAAEAETLGLTILPVSCLDVCPRGAMAIAMSAPRGRGPARTMVVRTALELHGVCKDLVEEHAKLAVGVDAASGTTNDRLTSLTQDPASQDPQTSSPDNS